MIVARVYIKPGSIRRLKSERSGFQRVLVTEKALVGAVGVESRQLERTILTVGAHLDYLCLKVSD